MPTPYQTRQLERIIASAIARRFVGNVSEEDANVIFLKQEEKTKAEHEYRMAVEQAVDKALKRY